MRSRKPAAGVAPTAREKADAVVAAGQDDKPEAPPRRSRKRAAAAAAEEPVLPGMTAVGDEAEADQDEREQADARKRKTSTEDPATLSLGGGVDRIVDTLFDLPDAHEEYLAVKASLRLGTRASRADYGTLVDALDAAEDMAERAYRIFVNAKVARDAYDIDAQAIEAGMREQANAALQAEKDAKTRSKAITDADVVAYMAAKFPDEWRDVTARRGRARRTISYLENLSYRAAERAKDLRQMVARARDA